MDFFVKKSVGSKIKYNVEVLVVSDIHLGTMASNASALFEYLKSKAPKTLILNGDIIDAWRFSRNYFPKSHLKVIRQFIKLMENGTRIVYIAGNHDEILRKFAYTRSGRFKIVNHLTLKLGNDKVWFIHGDQFDSIVSRLRWLSKLGAAIYGFISLINLVLNKLSKSDGKRLNLYKKRILGFKSEDISRFEKKAANEAIRRGVQTVVCGHTHIPAEKNICVGTNTVNYLNSGDWVENNSALEYHDGQWQLLFFNQSRSAETDFPEYIAPMNQNHVLFPSLN
jgi:UDP-2,3-diacylglucosamine pyrophosphatase LpxH